MLLPHHLGTAACGIVEPDAPLTRDLVQRIREDAFAGV
jgi:hypothetical protein